MWTRKSKPDGATDATAFRNSSWEILQTNALKEYFYLD